MIKLLVSKVLAIDDDRSARLIIESAFRAHPEIEVTSVSTGEEGLQLLETLQPTVALLDIYMPGLNGLELFKKMKALDRRLPVIFITGDTSSETAIEAMRSGAFDYIGKPIRLEQLRSLVQSAIAARRLMDEPVALQISEQETSGEQFIGRSPVMIEVFKQIGRVAAQNVTVLVRGESGCGKELVARALVQHSDRADKPFIAVNCAAIPDQLLESELFGHEKGAFTGAEKRRIGKFEQCNDGTIFLDEVGDMAPLVQGKVLRLLQEQRFERVGGNEQITTNVRIITATNRPLEQMVQSGEFREDLLYRLNGFTINLPPLRERRDDIPLLLEYFLRRARGEMKKGDLRGIAPAALELLVNYGWPGNIRELQSVVRQAVLRATGTVISAETLPDFVRAAVNSTTQISAPSKAEISEPVQSTTTIRNGEVNDHSTAQSAWTNLVPVDEPTSSSSSEFESIETVDSTSPSDELLERELTLRDSIQRIDHFIEERLAAESSDVYNETVSLLERYLFTRVLEHTGGNQSKTAEILGITRGKVRDRIATFKIQLDKSVTLVD